MYSMRLDRLAVTGYNKLIDILNKRCSKYLSCIEKKDTSDEHVHVMLKSKWGLSTLRKDIQKILIVTGNKAYSLKVVKYKNTTKTNYKSGKAYTCKGTEPAKFILLQKKGYTSKQIKKYNKRYWDIHDALKRKSVNKGSPVFIQIFKCFETLLENLIIEDGHHVHNEKQIRLKVIKWYTLNLKSFPNPITIKNVSLSVYSHLLYKRNGQFQGNPEKIIFNLIYPMEHFKDEGIYIPNLEFVG